MTGILLGLAFVAGYAVGCASYALTYAVFRANMESRARAQMAAWEAKAIANRARVEATKERIQATYGQDLSKRHEVIVDEEIEKILSQTNTRDR